MIQEAVTTRSQSFFTPFGVTALLFTIQTRLTLGTDLAEHVAMNKDDERTHRTNIHELLGSNIIGVEEIGLVILVKELKELSFVLHEQAAQ
jgi:hypothetical protein